MNEEIKQAFLHLHAFIALNLFSHGKTLFLMVNPLMAFSGTGRRHFIELQTKNNDLRKLRGKWSLRSYSLKISHQGDPSRLKTNLLNYT